MQSLTRNLDHPIRKLITLFLCWKVLLLLVALCSPGPGYDTSSNLREASNGKELPIVLDRLVNKLKRWDAIYFVKTAERGHLFEQEWAFGWGFTRVIALCTGFLKNTTQLRYEGLEALVAISVAHIAHLISVVLIFDLSLAVFPGSPPNFAFTAALLHIVSPAGLFLSSPYAESSCAALSFAGCLLFVKSIGQNGKSTAVHDLYLLISGVLFGIATTFRSNGILNGLLLLEEALRTLSTLPFETQTAVLRRIFAAGLGGLSVAVGFLLPQYIAYQEYCGIIDTAPREWCQRTLPSIYTFVQNHYWNCGPFRYWTVSNLPLFVLATPMFAILIASGAWAIRYLPDQGSAQAGKIDREAEKELSRERTNVLRNMAISQLFLVLLTLTTAHVQIITRISSAYPVWLWYLSKSSGEGRLLGAFAKFMVLYCIIQGGLYASFLPPA
ncbi:related to Dolichyl-phosphate-mannose-protein mannosyltransferase [Phialocephala subalpina]|uniref:GPI mannosyltransferase 2 n=1 Tax=Phialocephala subalpina TaxID=576137 RepID=A0A1L7WWE2_9HELO|nr:related to Dolichyl-phosphate-mannose-protein mannosyltransferase [Phialocephala subalpina]